MEKIIKKDGYVYLIEDADRKGFETYHNLGKDPDSPMWKEDFEKPKINKKKKSED